MTKLARLLIVAVLTFALAPAVPAVAGHVSKAKNERVAKKKKAKKTKKKAAVTRSARTTVADPGTSVADPGSSIPDPGTSIPDPGASIPDPGTVIPDPTGNPAQQCKAEMAQPGFAEKYATNPNKANAFGKCVSAKAHAKQPKA